MCAVDPVCVAIVIEGFLGVSLLNFLCYRWRVPSVTYLSDRHLHLICRTESQERNIKTRISGSLVLSSEQRNVVVQWLIHLRIWNVSACGCRHGDRPYRPMFFHGLNFFSRYWFSFLRSTMTVTFFNIITRTVLSFSNESKQFSRVGVVRCSGNKVKEMFITDVESWVHLMMSVDYEQ